MTSTEQAFIDGLAIARNTAREAEAQRQALAQVVPELTKALANYKDTSVGDRQKLYARAMAVLANNIRMPHDSLEAFEIIIGDDKVKAEEIANPEWSDEKIHNWHTHISDELKAFWKTLSFDAKVAAYVVAKASADSEEWE